MADSNYVKGWELVAYILELDSIVFRIYNFDVFTASPVLKSIFIDLPSGIFTLTSYSIIMIKK